MASGRVVRNGLDLMLQYLVNKATTQDLVLRLFTNDVMPDEATVVGDLTEASGSGYSSITLTGSSWAVSALDSASVSFTEQTFSFTGALGDVYGFYLTRATGGELVAAYRFETTPQTVTGAGTPIKVTPYIQSVSLP